MASSAEEGYLECIQDPRSLVPINIMCLGGTIHFFLCLALFWQCGRGRYDSRSVSNFQQRFDQNLLPNDSQIISNSGCYYQLFALYVIIIFTVNHNLTK